MVTLFRLRALPVLAVIGALCAPVLAAQVAPARPDSTRADSARADSALADSNRAAAPAPMGGTGADSASVELTPAPDQSRGVDAELRIALLELTEGQTLEALSRIEWLASSPVALGGVQEASTALLSRQAMLFLMSQAQYRLGMSDEFRTTAQQLLAAPNADRYGALLRLQLMLDAYRRGEYARVGTYASGAGLGEGRALAALINGLAQYATRQYAAARSSFDAAAQTRGPFNGYARYMSALAAMAGDSTKAGEGLEAMRALAGQAMGEFADQANLSAAQLAYQRGQYDVAASLAANVAPTSGIGAAALLTRGWALYKSDQLDASATAFRDFATRYPQLPQRDEARLMVGQVMLQSGRTDEAGQYFQTMADSIATESSALQARASTSMADAARALVAARATALLFVRDPAEGKTLAVPTRHSEVTAIVVGAPVPDTLGLEADARPDLVTLTDVEGRLDSLSPVLGATFPRRLMHVPATGGTTRTAYLQRMAALRRADVAVAMARWRLQQQLDAYAARIAVTQNLRAMLTTENERLTAVGQTLAATRDSLARLVAAITETQARLKGILASEAEATRALAAENIARMDSIRTTMRGVARPEDESVLDIERSTAARYQQLSETIAAGLDSAFARHPVTVARDTVQARLARDQQLLAETQGGVVEASRILGEELARLQAGEPERVRTGRAALARAEGQRTAEEGQLVAAVDAELRARAGQLLAVLRRDAEAAEFGAASAAFFKAAEGTGAATPDGTGSAAGGTAGGVRDETPSASPSSKPIPPR